MQRGAEPRAHHGVLGHRLGRRRAVERDLLTAATRASLAPAGRIEALRPRVVPQAASALGPSGRHRGPKLHRADQRAKLAERAGIEASKAVSAQDDRCPTGSWAAAREDGGERRRLHKAERRQARASAAHTAGAVSGRRGTDPRRRRASRHFAALAPTGPRAARSVCTKAPLHTPALCWPNFRMGSHASASLAELGVDETAASITGRYSFGPTLGEGRFSQVVAATCVRTSADVALKAMALAEVTDDKEAREMLAQEVAVLRRANGCQVPDARHTHAARSPRSHAPRPCQAMVGLRTILPYVSTMSMSPLCLTYISLPGYRRPA